LVVPVSDFRQWGLFLFQLKTQLLTTRYRVGTTLMPKLGQCLSTVLQLLRLNALSERRLNIAAAEQRGTDDECHASATTKGSLSPSNVKGAP
jgi:hypothetical protein